MLELLAPVRMLLPMGAAFFIVFSFCYFDDLVYALPDEL